MIDAQRISERLGVRVFLASFSDPKILAIASVKDRIRAKITVNDSLDEAKQNFIIAHQLGHFVYDHFKRYGILELKDSDQTTNNLFHIDELERSATRFAMSLVAPRFVLEGFIRKGITDVDKISKALGVEKTLLKSYIGPML